MQTEIVQSVTFSASGEIRVQLGSGGKPLYQYVYRAAAGVYWHQTTGSFTFLAPKDGPFEPWVAHMVNVVKSELGVDLVISVQT
jgi:hypothetical protein